MNWDGLITMAVLIGFGLLIYSNFKKQTIKETMNEIKEVVVTEE
tara:strand:- start:430 stop:561 length:132 start_codon:yes stop_codon:yes gene_type:complete